MGWYSTRFIIDNKTKDVLHKADKASQVIDVR